MASNFRIHLNRDKNTLLINIEGDFDGSSAYELLNLIIENTKKFEKVIINTTGLRSIHSFGTEVFKKKFFMISAHSKRLIFTGNYELIKNNMEKSNEAR